MTAIAMTLADLVQRLAEETKEHGVHPSVYVREHWEALGLNGEDVVALAQIGLAQQISDLRHHWRCGSFSANGDGPIFQQGAPHPKTLGAFLRASLSLDSIDIPLVEGGSGSLRDASLEDLVAHRETMRGQVRGLRRREKALNAMIAALEAKRVQHIADLPDREQRRLETIAVEAWGAR